MLTLSLLTKYWLLMKLQLPKLQQQALLAAEVEETPAVAETVVKETRYNYNNETYEAPASAPATAAASTPAATVADHREAEAKEMDRSKESGSSYTSYKRTLLGRYQLTILT